MHSVAPFDLGGRLPTGVTVLEASAGTGKTFTIAGLATRFIAEGVAGLDQLLLVTFTRVATSELRERVRERLVLTEAQLTRVAAGVPPTRIDDVVATLAADGAEVVRQRQERLAHAIANFDAATIETTHGFCQRVLDSLGTLAETDPGVSFVDSVDDLTREVIDDLYVRRFYRDHDGLTMPRDEAERIARIAIENPLAPIHPAEPRDGTLAAMRRRLALAARNELEHRKRAGALMTHDDQLTRLLATLTGEHGAAAITSLRQRFRVVLIDEFQDTDPIQWEIVERAFGDGQTTLVLIGDPKQAIYAFRGADVYAYLDAARSAGNQATLAINWRSDQPLLDGLDALFGAAQLGHPGIVYRRVSAANGNREPRLLGAPEGRAVRVRLVGVDEPSVERTGSGFAKADSARAFIARDLAADVVALLHSGAETEERDEQGDVVSRRAIAPGDVAVLVRTHRHARLIQQELEALGVAAVIGGSGSVFETEAASDWLVLLESLEQPSHPGRARAAALTSPIGWSATELAQANEASLEQLHQHLHGWARTLREQGVSALTQVLFNGERTAARLLALVGCERRVTDLEHVAQLLGAAAGVEQYGVAALTGWLRQRITAADREGANEERTRRLDSDADAVQVLTFHQSKGLEFPIVYCPFLWDAGKLPDEGRPVYFHDEHGQRAIDVALEGADYRAHLHQHQVEERGEELRLAYVALTRARHQVVIWWASSWYARDSPLGRLLFAQDADGHIDWQGRKRPREQDAHARLEEAQRAAPHAIALEPARLGAPVSWSPGLDREAPLERARFNRRIDTSWRRTSYSALTAGAHELPATTEPEDPGISDEPATTSAPSPSELPLSQMAGGTQVGTLIHRALQELDFTSTDLTGTLREWLVGATAHRPELLGADPSTVAEGLALALATPLGGELGSLALCDVSRADRLDELTFELPLAGGDRPVSAAQLGDLAELLERMLPSSDPISGYAARLREPALAATLRGYLTGSIDLVLRVHGAARDRFTIVDYKTNWLAPGGEPLTTAHYGEHALGLEMQRSHYVLQGLLYAVALHRYLRWRLKGYDPETDLAGIRYLFLRGMLGPATAAPGGVAGGVFAWHPPAALVVALSDLLAGGTSP